MLPRAVFRHRLDHHLLRSQNTFRCTGTATQKSNVNPNQTLSPGSSTPRSATSDPRPQPEPPSGQHPQSWLTRAVKASPVARSVFMGVARLLGYGTPRQLAGRRAFQMYEQLCVPRADEECQFWREGAFYIHNLQSSRPGVLTSSFFSVSPAANIPVLVHHH
jgi:cytochrome b pre-mRNA-processing protein 3